MSVAHYENFPVGSILVPVRLRRPIAAIYYFARSADDIADEGDATPEARIASLRAYSRDLDLIAAGKDPSHPILVALSSTIREFELPIELFHDLLSAFTQDVTRTRYETFVELLDYCRRSANPIGRLLLHLFERTEPVALAQSDSICSALQLVNFLQDVAIDYRKGRIYIPLEDLDRFGVRENQIAHSDPAPPWPALMAFEIDRARAMLNFGQPLTSALRGRIRLEIALVIQGGLRMLEKLDRVNGNAFQARPMLRPSDWGLMLARALRQSSKPRREIRSQP